MEKTAGKQRQSNLELLRIVAMLLIVALHYAKFAFVIPEDEPVSSNTLLLNFLAFGGRMSVDLFVLISGYFKVNQCFRGPKAIKLWLQTFCALVVVGTLLYIFDRTPLAELKSALQYILTENYWFISTYFVLYLLSDFINAMIFAVSRERLRLLIWSMLVIVSILPTFLGIRLAPSNLFLFVTMYLIGAYIRIFSPKIFEAKCCLLLGIALHWLCCAASCVMILLGGRYPVLTVIAKRLPTMTDSTLILSAVLIFSGFKNMNIKNSRVINALAASAFGVYLLHFNPFAIECVWHRLFNTQNYLHSPQLLLNALAAIPAMYLLCTLIDMLYRRIIEKPVMAFVDKHWDGWHEAFTRAFREFWPEE